MKALILLLLLITPITLYASNPTHCKLSGKVIKITDGDTITVLDRSNQQHKIRLAGIDAPERNQPYGKASKKYLSKLVAKKWVCIDWNKLDKYKRIVGKVIFVEKDINLEIIKAGLAWHYKKYSKEQSKQDERLYAESEIDAQLATVE